MLKAGRVGVCCQHRLSCRARDVERHAGGAGIELPGGNNGRVRVTERVLIETEDGLFRIRARSKYGIQTDGSYSYLS